MGIKNLSKYLKETYPGLFETIHISEYAFKKIAIDVSLYLYHYKAAYGESNWLGAFIKLVACLRENELHCVFIYDSGFPPEKEAEQKKRKESRNKMEKRVYKLEEAIDQYHSSGEVDPILLEFQAKRKLNQARLLRPNQFAVNIGAIEYAVKNMRRQLFTITPGDFATTKQLFDILQVPYLDAPSESETLCADLCIQGEVDGVLSEDSDVLAYGAPVFLTKLNTADGTCVRIKYDEVLRQMGLSPDEFLDFCILCGTDYNKNIFRVGPNKAYKLISEHKNIETISKKTVFDVSILNHIRTRQLFRDYPKSIFKIPYCGTPDFLKLQAFIIKKNVQINVESLHKSFIHNAVVFEDEKSPDDKFQKTK